MVDGRSFLDQTEKNYEKTCDNIRKDVNGHIDDHTTGCLLHFSYFKNIVR